MATPRSQRIGIWIIAVVMLVGTLGSFLIMVLSVQNQGTDQTKLQEANLEYQADIDSQTKQLSDKYYSEFSKYSANPKEFNPEGVDKVAKKDLKLGDGAKISSGTAYSAYYIGWNPKGVIFDQSISDGTLKAPIAGGSMIPGWEEGVSDMKIGGVREITIPSDKAYGAVGSGDNIPPNSPLKFIVMVIPKVSEVSIPPVLLQYYQEQAQLSN